MKITKTILLIFLVSSLALFNGCDQLENFEVNIPIEVTFHVSGDNAADASETITFCLNQYDEWNDNKENLQSVKYLKAAYWTMGYSPAALMGTISFALYDNSGTLLISGTLPNVSPGDYINSPLEFELTSIQVEAFNTYLSEIRNSEDPSCMVPSFTAVGSITGVSGTTGLYDLAGKVELVLAAEVSP